MHHFPVHKLHSFHTPVTIMYTSNGCSSNVLVLQKMFWTQFGPEFPIIFTKSIHLFSLFKCHSSFQPVSTPQTSTSRRFSNIPCNNNDISYITTHHITQYCSASRATVKIPLLRTLAGINSVRSRWSYYRCFGLPDHRQSCHQSEFGLYTGCDEPFLYTVYLSRYYIKINPSICYSIIYHKFHTQINNSNY